MMVKCQSVLLLELPTLNALLTLTLPSTSQLETVCEKLFELFSSVSGNL